MEGSSVRDRVASGRDVRRQAVTVQQIPRTAAFFQRMVVVTDGPRDMRRAKRQIRQPEPHTFRVCHCAAMVGLAADWRWLHWI